MVVKRQKLMSMTFKGVVKAEDVSCVFHLRSASLSLRDSLHPI